ncbi:hypothetical protein OUZ56_010583 [Daphnia magna]|uniref:Uncharacterized protein n=1 Tax=Daphnia magna TaxID=35525 RepID=A0ABR0AIY2_9CRUS|nr:hypothetical protein OUZ56_010583 [Daphnia magna]
MFFTCQPGRFQESTNAGCIERCLALADRSNALQTISSRRKDMIKVTFHQRNEIVDTMLNISTLAKGEFCFESKMQGLQPFKADGFPDQHVLSRHGLLHLEDGTLFLSRRVKARRENGKKAVSPVPPSD